MSHKVFRNTSFVLAAFIVVSMFAVTDSAPDDASWSENFVAFSTTAAPWIIASVVVWAAAEIIKAMTGEKPE